MLSDLLTKAGYDVPQRQRRGRDRQAREIKPDLILMDVVMPGLNGFQATRAISRDPVTKSIPVIMCTPRARRRTRSGACARGARLRREARGSRRTARQDLRRSLTHCQTHTAP